MPRPKQSAITSTYDIRSRSEQLYAIKIAEEDRKREIKRQAAYESTRANAHLFRRPLAEPSMSYQNSDGLTVTTSGSLPISLC